MTRPQTGGQTSVVTKTATGSAKEVDQFSRTESTGPSDIPDSTLMVNLADVNVSPSVSVGSYPSQTSITDSDGKTAVTTFVYDLDKREALSNLTLMGSWNNKGNFTTEWKESAVPMTPVGDGKWEATVPLVDDGPHDWEWGVKADGPAGPQEWAMFGETPEKFQPKAGQVNEVSYAPRTYAQTGVVRQGDDVKVRFFAQKAANVQLCVWNHHDQPAIMVPLKQDQAGFWNASLEGKWKSLEGKSYGFSVTSPDGQTKVHSDPYARQLEGPLRGVADLYLNPLNGQEVNPYWKAEDQGKSVLPSRFFRFEVPQEPDAVTVNLRLFGPDGKSLTKDELATRLGQDGKELVEKFEGPGAFWADNCQSDGRIALKKEGTQAWGAVVNNPAALDGLTYRFEVSKKDADGKVYLVGDTNHDGVLSAAEARHTAFNDPFYPHIGKSVGTQRMGIVCADDGFDWKNPSPQIDKNKAVIYQLHVGSFMGQAGNVQKSTFKDLTDQLDYFKDLGINTIEMLPSNPFEGQRNWGYQGTSSASVAEQYGFQDDSGRWVSGPEAMKHFIDEAHGRGIQVFDDVVYNHLWSGTDQDNLANLDGPNNCYFNYNDGIPNQWGTGVHGTDWGPMPAFNNPAVKQFIVDSAMTKLDDYHLDGLRFDFTKGIHAQDGGSRAGWETLREINREAHFFHPHVTTSAEEIPMEAIMTTAAGPNLTGGAGFDQMWNPYFQHRLIHDNNPNEPSVLQAAVQGRTTNMDALMNNIAHPEGFNLPENAVTVISNHDEVAIGGRTITIAENGQADRLPTSWERGSCRAAFGIGMFSAGTPMFFQGEESLAKNTFQWGVPSTWDTGWDWLDKKFDVQGAAQATSQGKEAEFVAAAPGGITADDVYRRLHFDFSKAAIGLRKSSPAFDANMPAQRVYTHNENSVIAFTRKSGSEEFLVLSSLNHNSFPNYGIPVESGKWQLVLNSDATEFGGSGLGNPVVQGGPQANFALPAGSVMVYKKVD